jgi:hypothetical protein|tara:strand:+ start:639 stop:926 length:288 start_codon:yes stop_codon:yes gene_type:complete
MTDLNIDLNITHYNIQELEDILNLEKDYTFKDIQSSAIIVRNKIFKVTPLDLFKKKEINIFLNDAISKMERNFINNSLSNIDNKLNNLLNLFQNK